MTLSLAILSFDHHMTCDLKITKNRTSLSQVFDQDLIVLPKYTPFHDTNTQYQGVLRCLLEGVLRGSHTGPSLPTEQTRTGIKEHQDRGSTCCHYHEARWCSGAPRGCPAPDFRGRWVLLCGGQGCRLSRVSLPLSPGQC